MFPRPTQYLVVSYHREHDIERFLATPFLIVLVLLSAISYGSFLIFQKSKAYFLTKVFLMGGPVLYCIQYNGGLLLGIILLTECYGNTFKCHEDVLSLQTMITPKRFDIFPPVKDAQKV